MQSCNGEVGLGLIGSAIDGNCGKFEVFSRNRESITLVEGRASCKYDEVDGVNTLGRLHLLLILGHRAVMFASENMDYVFVTTFVYT